MNILQSISVPICSAIEAKNVDVDTYLRREEEKKRIKKETDEKMKRIFIQ